LPARPENLRPGRIPERNSYQRPSNGSKPLGRKPEDFPAESLYLREGQRNGHLSRDARDGSNIPRTPRRGGIYSRPAGFRGGRGMRLP